MKLHHMFERVGSLVFAAVNATVTFPGISPSICQKFCYDIAIVSIGIRTAYLLDLFSLPEAAAREFIATLRKEPPFGDLIILYHEHAGQSFFVNTSLLQDRLKEATGSTTPMDQFFDFGKRGLSYSGYAISASVLVSISPESTRFNSLQCPNIISIHTSHHSPGRISSRVSYFLPPWP